jgi:Bacterial PH domain
MILLTKFRIVVIDVKRSQGKITNISYKSLLWSSVIIFGVKLAGQYMDQSTCDLLFYTSMMFDVSSSSSLTQSTSPQPGMSLWELDCILLAHMNVSTIHQYMALHCCRDDPLSNDSSVRTDSVVLSQATVSTKHDEYGSSLSQLFQQLTSSSDRTSLESRINDCQITFHTTIPILIPHETIIHCSVIGRGDFTLFTNIRIIEIDTQGWSDQRIVMRSVPYRHIRASSVTTNTRSSSSTDGDTIGSTTTSSSEQEIQLYTGNLWSLQKFRLPYVDRDIMAISKWLAHAMLLWNDNTTASDDSQQRRLLEEFRGELNHQRTQLNDLSSKFTKSLNMKSVMTSVTDNCIEISDVSDMNRSLHNDRSILLENEQIERLFQRGRDYYIYTNLRLLYMDVQGIPVIGIHGGSNTGSTIVYTSLPWTYCTGYTIVTCNTTLDRDAELYLYYNIPGRQRMKQSILINSCNIYDIQAYVCTKILLAPPLLS